MRWSIVLICIGTLVGCSTPPAPAPDPVPEQEEVPTSRLVLPRQPHVELGAEAIRLEPAPDARAGFEPLVVKVVNPWSGINWPYRTWLPEIRLAQLELRCAGAVRAWSLRHTLLPAVHRTNDAHDVLDLVEFHIEPGRGRCELVAYGPWGRSGSMKFRTELLDRFDGPIDLVLTGDLRHRGRAAIPFVARVRIEQKR